MIPESWLTDQMETADFAELTKREWASSGLSGEDLQKLLAQGPSQRWLEKWRDFISQKAAGDELWFFRSPPETWRNLAGRAGVALVRSGHVIASIVTSRN